MNIDYERLRNELIDYFGDAMVVVFQVGMLDIDIFNDIKNIIN